LFDKLKPIIVATLLAGQVYTVLPVVSIFILSVDLKVFAIYNP
jgi:hypothetical protein